MGIPTSDKHVDLFNQNIRHLFRDALRISLKDPGMALFILRTLYRQNRAARTRAAWERRDVHVPPLMIVSVTNSCNLHCQGCYAQAHRRPSQGEMSAERLHSVIAEARDLGISIALIAGGEPLTRPEILDIIGDFPEIVFPLFTNGLLIDENVVGKLKRQRNTIPVISLEGWAEDTDRRRGAGVYELALDKIEMLKERGVFFGTSITLTRQNFSTVTGETFLGRLMSLGCRLFFFVEYVPIQEGTEHLILTAEQKAAITQLTVSLQARKPGLFVAGEGDEEMYGGCLAAGRGFIHISPEGRLEPCPFSPVSDTSVKDVPLHEALQSAFLKKIRESDAHLSETRGGCALWEQREWVASLL
jgi:MoaA/NifB/PqqE/SkfB family radical SAM enzyme